VRGYVNFRMWLYKNHYDIYFDNKTELKTIFDLYIHYMDEGYFVGDNIYEDLDDSEEDKLFEKIWNKLMEKVEAVDFSDVETKAMEIFKEENKDDELTERNLRIYSQRNFLNVQEQVKNENLSPNSIYEIIRNLKGKYVPAVDRYTMGSINFHKGHIFEEEYGKFLKSTDMFDEVIIDGSSGEPDVVALKNDIVIVFSLKNVSITDRNMKRISAKKFAPEIRACRKDFKHMSKRFMVIVLYNNDINEVFHIKYNYMTPVSMVIKKFMKKA